MEEKTITISDVAKAANVSLGTVSRVLNNRDGKIKISEKTKNKVLKTAEELGYRPNPFASALRARKTGIIGAVIRDIDDPFLRKIIRDVQKECHDQGLELLIGHAEYELMTAQRQINLMITHLFDGLFFLGNMPGDAELIYGISEKDIPVVSIAGSVDQRVSSVNYDNEYGTRLALDHLFSLGHRRIAFMCNEEHAGVPERLQMFVEYLKEQKLPCPEEYLRRQSKSGNNAIADAKYLLQLPTPPTAILCSSDLLAIGAMSGAWQTGRQVPRDISIMGYDDIDEAEEAYAPLTTIRQATDTTAEKAVEMLSTLIGLTPKSRKATQYILKPELVIRASCAAPA
jgi:Transcriptional regulators